MRARSSVWLVAALALLAGAHLLAQLGAQTLLPPLQRPPVERYASLDAANLIAGTRRFGADLAFIQLLHLVSGPLEDAEMKESHPDEHGHDHAAASPGIGEIVSYGLRPVNLDPYFHYAYLFGSGMLAFYLNEYPAALDILKRGIDADPTYWRFRLYAGAIGYRSANEMDKAIPLLEEAVKYPDCPTMIMNILGNLYEKKGDFKSAAQLYDRILSVSKDDFERFRARNKLEAIAQRFQ